MQIARDITEIDPTPVFDLFGLTIANSTLLSFVITILIATAGLLVIRRFSLVPSKFQVAIEAIYESAYDLIAGIIGNEERARKAFPIIGAIMFYLVAANLIGLIPGVEQITYNGNELFRTPTSDFNTTFGLALGAVVIINLIAIKEKGLFRYLDQFIRVSTLWKGFKQGFGAGMIAIIEFFIGLLDIIGEVVKVVSLSLRLFGNMYAGQILAIILLGVFAIAVPSLWLAMSLFVAVLQAIVFASLVASYYMLATDEGEDEQQA